MAALFSMPARNEVVRAEISTAPESAVPIGCAQVGNRVLRAPYLAAFARRARTTRHGCELRRQSSDTEAREQHRPGHDLGARLGIESGDDDHDPGEQCEEPELHDSTR